MKFPRFLPAIAWLILITILLCLPGSVLPMRPWLAAIRADKLVHIALFGILCFLFDLGFTNTSIAAHSRINCFALVSITALLYGIAMEFVQLQWVRNRSFEGWDIGADGLGCVLGYFAARWYLLRREG